MNYFNYFTDIEEAFVRRRGKHLMISPKDWALIGAWEERGIPLHIVLRSIDTVFNAADKQRMSQTISSLTYCRSEIEAQFLAYNVSQVGKSDSGTTSAFTIETVEAHIDAAIVKLREITVPELADACPAAAAKLTDLRAHLTTDFEAVDAALRSIEAELEAALLTTATGATAARIEKTVTAQLAAYKSEMDPDAYQNTFTLMLLKRLREDSGIPRLGLFYL